MGILGNLWVKLGIIDKDLVKSLNKLQKKINKFSGEVGNLGRQLLPATIAIGALGGAAIKTAAEFETMEISFKTLLGSSQAAKKHMEDLQKFALVTPYNVPELALASKKMQAYGFNIKEVLPTLRKLGDASAALGLGKEGMDRLILAFGQMKAKGRVMAQEMNQITETGINAWKILTTIISKATGKTVKQAEAMDLVEKGAVNGAAAVKLMIEEIGRDPKFAGGMEAQVDTVAGAFSNLQVITTLALKMIGTEISDTFNIKENIVKFTEFIKGIAAAFMNLSPAVKKVIVIVAAFVAALAPALIALAGFGAIIAGIIPAITFLAGPFGMIVVVIGACIATFILLGVVIKKILEQNEELKNKLISVWNDIKKAAAKIWTVIAAVFGFIWGLVKEYLKGFFDSVASIFGSIVNIIYNAVEFIKNIFTKKWGDALSNALNIWMEFHAAIGKALFGKKIYNDIKYWLVDKLSMVFNWLVEQVNKLINLFNKVSPFKIKTLNFKMNTPDFKDIDNWTPFGKNKISETAKKSGDKAGKGFMEHLMESMSEKSAEWKDLLDKLFNVTDKADTKTEKDTTRQIELEAQARIAIMKDGYEKELALLKEEHKKEIKEFDDNNANKKDLLIKHVQEKKALKDKYAEAEAEAQTKISIAIMKDGLEKELLLLEEQQKKELQLFEKNNWDKKNLEIKYQQEITAIKEKYEKKKIEDLRSAIKELGVAWKDAFAKSDDAAQGIDKVFNSLQKVIDLSQGGLTNAISNIGNLFTGGLTNAITGVTQLIGGFNIVSNVINGIGGLLNGIFGKGEIEQWTPEIDQEKYVQTLNNFKDFAKTTFLKITDYATKTSDYVAGIFNRPKLEYYNFLGIRGDVRMDSWQKYQEWVAKYTNLGFVEAQRKFIEHFTEIGKALQESVTSAFSNGIKNFLSGKGNILTDLTEGIKNAIVDAITTAVMQGTIIQGTLGNLLGKLTEGLAAGWDVTGIIADISSSIPGIADLLKDILTPLREALTGAFPEIPAMANGGTITKSGLSLVGENGPELRYMPEGASIVPLRGGGTNPVTINLIMDNRTVAKAILPELKKVVNLKLGALSAT